ncbi:MAG: hypothetical protein ACO1SX_06900 [Actinomycetota bacterium]
MNARRNSALLASVMLAGAVTISAASPASAESSKEKMYRIGTYAAGAATAYGLIKNKDTIALIGAAGTYLAHRGWKSEINKRHDNRYRNRRNIIRRRR